MAAASRSTPSARRCATCRRSATLTVCAAASCRSTAFFEWKAIKGQKAKQPYAIAMSDGSPFGIAGLWENWKEPASGEWIRTFAIITTDANEMVADIHDRMPAILLRDGYARWLSDEPDPRDLMRPFPAGLMRMWPISTRVNKPENDDPSIVEPIELAAQAA
jgi:putative SOS response-associated peptidase YedK